MKENTRPLLFKPNYHISETGRLYGPNGQLAPEIARHCRARSCRYAFNIGGEKKRFTVQELMRTTWGIEFSPTVEWVATVVSEWRKARDKRDKDRAKKKKAKLQKPQLAPIKCSVCQEYFTPENGNQHTCKNGECQLERQRRATRSTRARKKAAENGDSVDVPQVMPTFPCPFTDHYDEKDHFTPRAGTLSSDFPDYSFAQNDPFGRYGDYEHHAVRKNEPQQEKIAA